MRIGLTQYTAGAAGLKLLERAAELGITGVEPMIASANSEYLSWPANDIECFVKQARKMKISVPATAMAIFNDEDSLVNSEGKDRAVNLISLSLKFASVVGAKAMLLCTFFASHPNTDHKKDNLHKVLCEVEQFARNLHVAIALESPLPAKELAEMIDKLNSPFVGAYYDVGNALYLGYDPAGEIEYLAQRILSVHMKDTVKNLGDSHLGCGRLNLETVFTALKRINYSGWLIIETPNSNDAALKNDIRLLHQYLEP
jgi:hexulose-6-phosphate isomerase